MNQILLERFKVEYVQKLLSRYGMLPTIIETLSHNNACIYLVGGAVRDLVLNIPVKDVDIEIHGLEMDVLEKILSSFGVVNSVGKSFGVLRLAGLDIDWSLPRSDSSGRKPDVIVDPFMSLKEALRRRDLTMNAMALDLISYELHDPFGGREDMRLGILRTPDEQLFVQDPLRFFRVMQFVGRFEMYPDAQLMKICKEMDISKISRERIEAECEKLFLKSVRPSLGFRWLSSVGRLQELFPELDSTVGVIQGNVWHPEGDVFEHSMQTLDAAAQLAVIHEKRLALLYAALMHDLGKPETTQVTDSKVTSYGHEEISEKKAQSMLKRITRNADLISTVRVLVRNHMSPGVFVKQRAKPSAYKRLALKLAPYADLELLGALAVADRQGRNLYGNVPLQSRVSAIDAFFAKARELDVLKQVEAPILLGKDLLDSVEPGPLLGKLVKQAYEIQINEDIKDKDELKRRVLKNDINT